MMNGFSTILLVDNDVSTAMPLISGLQDQGFRAIHAVDGHQGLEWARAAQPDLILMEARLPRMDGFTVCRTLRRESAVPIIMLSARGDEWDRIKGLELGADDYMVKPVSPAAGAGQGFRELVARVRALLRRCELDRRQAYPPRDQLVVGDVVLDRPARQVWKAGRLLDLRQRELDLLGVLMEHAGQALHRHDLLDRVWGEEWVGDPRTLDVHICWLRGKLEDEPAAPRYIETVRGYGYRFGEPVGGLADAV